MSSYTTKHRSPATQLRSRYTGNGGYQTSPDDNCTSIHLVDPGSTCSEAEPTTIIQAYRDLTARAAG